jgi:SsrA-binding protein
MKIAAQNKKAFHDYIVLETIEAGIVLTGDEVKSVRRGTVNLVGAFAVPHAGELVMINAYIAPYSHAYQQPNEEFSRRRRVLLLHRRQLNKLIGDISRAGVTLVPLKIYFNDKQFVKVEIAICKHKKAHVRKEEIRERDIHRETRRELTGKYKF